MITSIANQKYARRCALAGFNCLCAFAGSALPTDYTRKPRERGTKNCCVVSVPALVHGTPPYKRISRERVGFVNAKAASAEAAQPPGADAAGAAAGALAAGAGGGAPARLVRWLARPRPRAGGSPR